MTKPIQLIPAILPLELKNQRAIESEQKNIL